MATKEILSVQHPLVKRAVQLRLDKKVRECEKRVVVSGKSLIRDLASVLTFDTLFFIGDSPPPCSATQVIRVSAPVLKKITGVEDQKGWAAILPMPQPDPSLKQQKRLLILDLLSDPGNLGALWRSAFGLGWDGVFLTPGTVDPFNDKALRSAKGTTFQLPYDWMTHEQIIHWAQEREARLYIADLCGSRPEKIERTPPLALVLSNESHGRAHWCEGFPKVSIPMNRSLESLNVACAGSILLYTLGL